MKKIMCVILLVSYLLILCSCGSIILPYEGTDISEISYRTVDYMGGATEIYKINFTENKVYKLSWYPGMDDNLDSSVQDSEFVFIKEFTEEEEKAFIDSIYTYGLLNINDKYVQTGICDGGGWTLEISFADGSKKTSDGSNASPQIVFNNCALPFYRLCGEQVLGGIPITYFRPPELDIFFRHETQDNSYARDDTAEVSRANYKWNDSGTTDSNLYELNLAARPSQFEGDGYTYNVHLSTSNYNNRNGKYEHFIWLSVKSYDFNPELTNEDTVFSGIMLEYKELPLELNKIYVYTLYFADGDYVEYTFNTKVNNDG